MPSFSRRTRFLLIVLAGAAAMLAGALPVLVSRGRPPVAGVTVQAGSVSATGPDSPATPGDEATPDTTGPRPTTSSVPAATASVPAPPTTTTASTAPGTVAACRAQDLAMDAGTDRTTYRPGDTIVVTATLTNQAAQPCWLSDSGTPSDASACYPEVLLQRFDASDGYNAVLGPYDADCGPAQTVLNPGDTSTGQVQMKFQPPQDCGPTPDAPACQLRSGTWTVVVNWLTQSAGGDTMSAEPVFFCPPDACSPAPSAGSSPSTTATTGPAASTTSTTGPASTSTTSAPAAHKSSTTTTTAKPAARSTTTTSRAASGRAGG